MSDIASRVKKIIVDKLGVDEAEVTNEDTLYRVKTNESTFIAKGAKHRLRNPLPNTALKIIHGLFKF